MIDSAEPHSRKKGPRMGAGATLHIRVTAETRAAVEAEAERTAHSMSEVAENWLDAARRGFANTEGLACADGLRRMARFARQVQERFGDPSVNRTAEAVLRAGIQELAAKIMPISPLAEGDEATFRVTYGYLILRLRDLLAELKDEKLQNAADNLPTLDRYLGPEPRPSGSWLRDLRTRLLELAGVHHEDHYGPWASDLAKHAAFLIDHVPAQVAARVEDDGRALARALLGSSTFNPSDEE